MSTNETTGTKTIAINRSWGGFNLSDKAWDTYALLSNKKLKWAYVEGSPFPMPLIDGVFMIAEDLNREDEALIETIRRLGSELASGPNASLKLVDIPIDVDYEIYDYDGKESIHETHRVWV